MIFSERKTDPTSHVCLDQEEECTDDDGITGMYSVSDVVCNSTISQLIRQLMEKWEMIQRE